MIALRRGQTCFQKLGPPRVSAEHLGGPVRHRAGGDPRIDGQTVADAPDGLSHSVIGSARKVDFAKLSKNFQHEIVSIFVLDQWDQGQQQIPSRDLVGGKRQTAGAL